MKRAAIALILFAVPFAALAESTDRYIVMTRQPFKQAIAAIGDEIEPSIVEKADGFTSINGFVAELTWSQVLALKKSRNVISVEPDWETHALEVNATADTVTPGQQTTAYGISLVNTQGVWPYTRGRAIDPSKPVHVAIADTGVLYTHPEFKDRYKGGRNTVASTDDPLDDNGHGTHVAGIIAAADDANGVIGVAPDVDFYAIKVLNSCGAGFVSNNVKAIDWVIAKKAEIGGNWVMNFSLGSANPSSSEQAAFQRAADSGVLVFAASGNEHDDDPAAFAYPGGYPTVESVGAIDSDQKIASFSNRGSLLKVVAPGVAVMSTWNGYSITTDDGRSFAALQMDAADTGNKPLCVALPNITAKAVACGVGNTSDFPASVRGKIALIERGGTDPAGTALTFNAKAVNAKNAGAVATIVYNIADRPMVVGYLGQFSSASQVPISSLLTRADGLSLLSTPDANITIRFGGPTYAALDGTSMATPHAVGVAALVWACAPNATARQVATAMEQTAKDLGDTGFDTTFGNGLVNALEAAKQLAPGVFVIGGKPLVPPFTGRVPGRRGH